VWKLDGKNARKLAKKIAPQAAKSTLKFGKITKIFGKLIEMLEHHTNTREEVKSFWLAHIKAKNYAEELGNSFYAHILSKHALELFDKGPLHLYSLQGMEACHNIQSNLKTNFGGGEKRKCEELFSFEVLKEKQDEGTLNDAHMHWLCKQHNPQILMDTWAKSNDVREGSKRTKLTK